MSNVLNEEKKHQVIALGKLGWTLRRIEEATGVRRETAGTDVLIRQIREAIAEDGRKEIIERLLKGRQERIRQGKSPGGNVRYGFRRRNKRLVIEPLEAEIVRLVFELLDDGTSHSTVAKALNLRGSRRRNGTEWTPRQVRAIAANREMYENGTICYGDVRAESEKLILLRKIEGNCGVVAL